MRVVFVSTVFKDVDTGPGIFANYLWRAFRDDPDLEFHVVAPEFDEVHPRLHASGTGAGSLALYRRVQEKALEVAAAGSEPAILHGNSTHGMGRLTHYGGPLIVQVNDYETAAFPDSVWPLFREAGLRKVVSTAWRHRQEVRVLRRANVALCNSEFTASEVTRHYRLAAARVRVLYKAVDTSDLMRPEPLPADPAPERPSSGRLVFVGSDWRRKGLDVLVRAMGALLPRHRYVSLAVIGPDPSDPGLSGLIREAGLVDRVRVVGRATRPELARYLWHGDVFVLPSRREALGVAVLEGMAAGLPIIATRVGGIPEMVRSGTEGLLVPSDDVDALAAALDRVLSDAPLRQLMRTASLRRVQAFSAAAMTARLKGLYSEILRQAERTWPPSRTVTTPADLSR